MAASLLKPGQQVAGYEVDALVGKGGMGEVYRARQISMDRIVALKILAPKLVKRDPAFAKRFVDEARAAGRLNHPNIVGVHDVGETSLTIEGVSVPIHYFSMEFIDGETVKDVIARVGAMPVAQIGDIMSAMVEALAYAEAQGVVHRDIKPENIMVSPTSGVKLADLGLAQEVGSENQDTEGKGRKVMGTPMFMSPEQAKGLAVGHASDQYSLGATLYNMLTGQPPFTGADAHALMKAHVREPVPDPRLVTDVPEAWRQLVMRMMAKDPAQRFANAAELRSAVRAAIAGEVGGSKRVRTARPAGVSASLPAEESMPPVVRKALIGAVIAAVVLIAFSIVPWSSRPADPTTSVTGSPSQPTTQPTAEDTSLVRARAILASLPADPAAAVARLDEALADRTMGPSGSALLKPERIKRQRDLEARQQAAAAAQAEKLARIDRLIANGQLAQAKSQLDAPVPNPDLVAKQRSETIARLDAALAALAKSLVHRAGAAKDDGDLGQIEGETAASPLIAAQSAAVAEAVTARRAQLAQAAQHQSLSATAGPRWKALADALDPLRYSTRYDDVRVEIAAVADGFPTPDTQAQARALLDLSTLAQRGEAAVRAHVKSRMPQVFVRINRELKKGALISVSDKELQIRHGSGAVARLDRQSSLLDYRPILAEALAGIDGSERDRVSAAFLAQWDPQAAAAAFSAMGNDPLAQAYGILMSHRSGPNLQGRIIRFPNGRIQAIYEFLPGDPRPLADFVGDGAEMGDGALIWKSTAALPRNDYAEASLPTLRWLGRVQPPMKVSAMVRLTRDTQGALIGIDAGGQRNRIVFNAKSFPGVVAVGSVFTGADGRFSVAPASRSAIDLSQPVRVEAVIDDRRRLTLSWNGNVVDKDRQIGDGPIGWIFQLYQMEGASQISVESLIIDGVWAP